MKPFQLTEVTEVTFTHINLRKEFHGEDKVQAIDLNFQIEGSNELLDLIDTELREMLYFNRASKDGQIELPDHLRVLPDLRAPKLNGQKHKYGGNDKYKGYTFKLDYGLGDDTSNIVFEDASAGKFSFETKDGGTVVIAWQVSYSGDALTDAAVTRLLHKEGEQVFITLDAPAVLQLVKGGKAKKVDQDQDEMKEEDDEETGEQSVEDIFTAPLIEAAAG